MAEICVKFCLPLVKRTDGVFHQWPQSSWRLESKWEKVLMEFPLSHPRNPRDSLFLIQKDHTRSSFGLINIVNSFSNLIAHHKSLAGYMIFYAGTSFKMCRNCSPQLLLFSPCRSQSVQWFSSLFEWSVQTSLETQKGKYNLYLAFNLSL